MPSNHLTFAISLAGSWWSHFHTYGHWILTARLSICRHALQRRKNPKLSG